MPQLHAGYVIDELYYLLAETNEDKHLLSEKISGLLNALSHFELETNLTSKLVAAPDSILCVADKLVSRGVPTRASIFLTSTLLDKSSLLKNVVRKEILGSIMYSFDDVTDSVKTTLFNSLHTVDPRIKAKDRSVSKTWEDHGSEYETSFLSTVLPSLGMECITQLLEAQKDFETILRFGNSENEVVDKFIKGTINNFLYMKVDFSLSFPYLVGKKLDSPTSQAEPGYRGVIIEIDGSQHDVGLQKETDEKRDDAVKKAGWYETQRLKIRNFTNPANSLTGLTGLLSKAKVYCHRIKTNFEEPLYARTSSETLPWTTQTGGPGGGMSPRPAAHRPRCILHWAWRAPQCPGQHNRTLLSP
jgi:hypothetical protein